MEACFPTRIAYQGQPTIVLCHLKGFRTSKTIAVYQRSTFSLSNWHLITLFYYLGSEGRARFLVSLTENMPDEEAVDADAVITGQTGMVVGPLTEVPGRTVRILTATVANLAAEGATIGTTQGPTTHHHISRLRIIPTSNPLTTCTNHSPHNIVIM